jgi:hypothetical protein
MDGRSWLPGPQRTPMKKFTGPGPQGMPLKKKEKKNRDTARRRHNRKVAKKHKAAAAAAKKHKAAAATAPLQLRWQQITLDQLAAKAQHILQMKASCTMAFK